MSTTLTNGLKLPDKGSVDWYADMQSNYAILDGAVGTIAAHTAALAGKAPLVHTHSKADITDFPVYGTTAGTICEGNDSRLSDARTPVAHTHGKADVTDLLNSNFIPSANNSYDLGSSSYQWKSVYAQSYYYNGVAWGLDKANVWSAWQTIEKTNSESLLRLRRTDIKIGDSIPANQINVGSLGFAGSDDFNLGLITCRDEINGNTRLVLATRQKYDSNGNRSNNGTVYESRVDIGITSSRALYLRPYVDNLVNLGTSTNKWKTLNGINPGALSLPNMDSTVSKTTELAAAIDKTQAANSWTADFTGILRITWYVKNLTGPFRCAVFNNADIRYATWGQTFSANDVWFFIISFPVQNGKTYYFDNSFTRTSEDTTPIVYGASAVYCLGNV